MKHYTRSDGRAVFWGASHRYLPLQDIHHHADPSVRAHGRPLFLWGRIFPCILHRSMEISLRHSVIKMNSMVPITWAVPSLHSLFVQGKVLILSPEMWGER